MLRPLPGLPVIRDLIVDMTHFFNQYHSIRPYLINDTPPPEKERLRRPRPAKTVCTSASCARAVPFLPVVLVESGQVRRPGLLQAYRFIADSRDEATGSRLDNLEDPRDCVGGARRGFARNDLIITRYLDAHEAELTDDDVAALTQLFELGDNDLLDLLLARKELEGALDTPRLRNIIGQMRSL